MEESASIGISAERVFQRRRDRLTVIARARAWRQLRARGCSLTAIGRASGYDHTSVLSLLRRLPALEVWLADNPRQITFKPCRAIGAPRSSPWVPEAVAQLKMLWAEGLTTNAIAYRIGRGITRDAVIGKVQREGLPPRKLTAPVDNGGRINPWSENHVAWGEQW